MARSLQPTLELGLGLGKKVSKLGSLIWTSCRLRGRSRLWNAMSSSTADGTGSSPKYTVIASAKRTMQEGSTQDDTKRAKGLFPLFTRTAHNDSMERSSKSAALVWHTSLGTRKTCLKATCYEPFAKQLEERKKGNFKGKAKIACFDLDGCLIKPKNGKVR
jgi:hypothetical protein